MKARALITLFTAIFAASSLGNAEKSKFFPIPVPAMRSRGTSKPVVTPDTIEARILGVGAVDVVVRRRSKIVKDANTLQALLKDVTTDYMESLCKDHFLQRQYRKLDGGVLWSRNERNLDCTVTFQTHSILQRFMLHFDLLQLDCNDHLYVYDGAHATAPPKADLSCRNTKQQIGALFTRSNFVTLKYVTDNWGTDANGFKLVITAVKDPKHGCKEFRCKQREFCVSADLMCDGVDHCADGSDEDTAALCPESGGGAASGVWMVAAAGGAVVAVVATALAVCCYCRRRAPARRTHLHLEQMASSNGGGCVKPAAESPAGGTRLPGNWALPAGPRGYNAARPGRLRARALR